MELIFAANEIAGLNRHQALETVPYSELLRYQTLLWYRLGIGARPWVSIGAAARQNRSEGLRS